MSPRPDRRAFKNCYFEAEVLLGVETAEAPDIAEVQTRGLSDEDLPQERLGKHSSPRRPSSHKRLWATDSHYQRLLHFRLRVLFRLPRDQSGFVCSIVARFAADFFAQLLPRRPANTPAFKVRMQKTPT